MTGQTVVLYDRSQIGKSGGDSFGKLYDELGQESTYSGKIMPIKKLTDIKDKVEGFLRTFSSDHIELLIVHGHGAEGLIGVGGGWRASSGPDYEGTITKSTISSQTGTLGLIAKALIGAMPTGSYPPIVLFTSCESGGGKAGSEIAVKVSEALTCEFDGCVVLLATGSTCVRKVKHAHGFMYKISKVNGKFEGKTVTKGYFIPSYRGETGYSAVEDYVGKKFLYSDEAFEVAVTL